MGLVQFPADFTRIRTILRKDPTHNIFPHFFFHVRHSTLAFPRDVFRSNGFIFPFVWQGGVETLSELSGYLWVDIRFSAFVLNEARLHNGREDFCIHSSGGLDLTIHSTYLKWIELIYNTLRINQMFFLFYFKSSYVEQIRRKCVLCKSTDLICCMWKFDVFRLRTCLSNLSKINNVLFISKCILLGKHRLKSFPCKDGTNWMFFFVKEKHWVVKSFQKFEHQSFVWESSNIVKSSFSFFFFY